MNNVKKWIPTSVEDAKKLQEVSENLGTNQLFSQLLINRGITAREDAVRFFSPDLASLHNPLLMKDMQAAVDRITRAIDQNECVWVYGDYDVDGTTSVALMYSFLRQFIGNIDYYIPDRDLEGYGISEISIQRASAAGCTLIVALDCGIRSVELVDYAKTLNIDYIICDHHLPGSTLPSAVAVLDPKRADCDYPFKELSGCGIGFKLAQALTEAWGDPVENYLEYLDLVAVSIASDLVPIQDENRTLAWHGLQKLRDKPCPGLKSIIDNFILKEDVDVTDVVFMIGPRINAAGRMADAKAAVRLLLAENPEEAVKLAFELNQYNTDRKGLDAAMTKEALQQIGQTPEHHLRKTTVVHNENWHKGVVGIVASRLIEQHYKPTIVLTKSDGKYMGSARSIAAFDVHDALTKTAHHLIQFGGHKFAAGLKLLPENLDAFIKEFEATAEHLTTDELTPVVEYEAELSLQAVSRQLLTNLRKFAPHGPGNMKPIFISRNIYDSGNAKTMGAGYAHLKLNVVSDECPKAIGATAFGLGPWYDRIRNGQRFDMVYTIEENVFRGVSKVELMVKDLRL
ncbi:MAG: single-stranded-DNA-specific exonuclease, partial [Bacteroidia bacterium]